jgi:hypothetical protein
MEIEHGESARAADAIVIDPRATSVATEFMDQDFA